MAARRRAPPRLAGELALESAGAEPLRLVAGDRVAIPPGLDCSFARSAGLELLEVALPARAWSSGGKLGG